jgi:segregation and condensation protein A
VRLGVQANVHYLCAMTEGAIEETQTEVLSSNNDTQAAFSVHLSNFEGPFDLLLQLISRHKMDVTEVALSVVTDDFIAYIRALEGSEDGWDLEKTTEFLVVAATLLDLKAARLLPSGEIEDEGDLALLEARDLLFARLLQYRAFKSIAAIFSERLAREERSFARVVALEAQFSTLLPEVLIGIGPERFAAIAQRVLSPKVTPTVGIAHIHAPLVSVAEEAAVIVNELRRTGKSTFRHLISDASSVLVVVARFLALLELYREGVVRFEQVIALGELAITWTGSAEGEVEVSDEFDAPIVQSEDNTNGDTNV